MGIPVNHLRLHLMKQGHFLQQVNKVVICRFEMAEGTAVLELHVEPITTLSLPSRCVWLQVVR